MTGMPGEYLTGEFDISDDSCFQINIQLLYRTFGLTLVPNWPPSSSGQQYLYLTRLVNSLIERSKDCFLFLFSRIL